MSATLSLTGRTFFLGTPAASAICISQEGFRILDEDVRSWGVGYLGNGIYVTRNLKEALYFAAVQSPDHDYVLKVEFTRGTRIARLEDASDPGLLDSLRREFGKEILSSEFAKAVPHNKHLKPRELFALMGYFAESPRLFDQAQRNIRRWLRRLSYHGYGNPFNDLGTVLFDPSRLELRCINRMPNVGHERNPSLDPTLLEKNPLQPANRTELLEDAETELKRFEENIGANETEPDSDAAKYRRELEHRRRHLDHYQMRATT